MSALEWVWYMRPHILASSDGNWRIYRSAQPKTAEVRYTLMRRRTDGSFTHMLRADNAQACKDKAMELTGGDA
ncbi:MAG: hypothetical protein KGL39_40080 [Patescibacteria group bacterium]|nr:hypothetical protein [Patescibacteria group bacterium]